MGEENPAFESDLKEGTKSDVTRKPMGIEPLALTPEQKAKKYKILKNVVIISFAFMLNFTSFNSMANLQSSINEKLGTTSLSVLYAAIVLSCAFIPSWLIKRLKTKWTLPVCMLCYSTYIAAQFYPTYYTLIPTAILLGLGAAPMWSAKCSYL
ncbi:UNVERIFIED_CONTAM: hypothetical protein GTU68_031675, partial [Idotea baltica]|nr:hypothetical protein [Idotea baltica]